MMNKSTQLGKNRTGMAAASKDLRVGMEEAPKRRMALSPGEPSQLKDLRQTYIREADPVGTVPPPKDMKGMMEAGKGMLKGKFTHTLINKMGERLAFERTGVRLYEALLTKAEIEGADVPIEDLYRYQKEELEHFHMLKECMESIGADPTSETPAADVSAVSSEGLMKVITDSRTNLAQSLEAILIAELADNEAWSLLIEMADEAGKEDFVKKFRRAQSEEESHLHGIRSLVKKLNLAEESLLQPAI